MEGNVTSELLFGQWCMETFTSGEAQWLKIEPNQQNKQAVITIEIGNPSQNSWQVFGMKKFFSSCIVLTLRQRSIHMRLHTHKHTLTHSHTQPCSFPCSRLQHNRSQANRYALQYVLHTLHLVMKAPLVGATYEHSKVQPLTGVSERVS